MKIEMHCLMLPDLLCWENRLVRVVFMIEFSMTCASDQSSGPSKIHRGLVFVKEAKNQRYSLLITPIIPLPDVMQSKI